jgi:integrase
VATTFAAVTHAFIDAKSAGWSIGQVRQWQSSLRKHAAALNDLPVSAIDVPAVLDVLKPIWLSHPETARRVRQRIELIMAYGEAHGYRSGNNPAGKPILNLLPVQKREITHFADMPLAELSSFMKTLTAVDSPVARALEFTILTAARASMVFGADWSEFDLTSKVWTIPRRATPDARGTQLTESRPHFGSGLRLSAGDDAEAGRAPPNTARLLRSRGLRPTCRFDASGSCP